MLENNKKYNIENKDLISYYCSVHITTKYSNEFDKNNKRKKFVYVLEKLFMIFYI